MTPREQDQLLRALLEDDTDALRQSTLRAGLRAVRRRRHRRIASYAVVFVLPWLLLFYPRTTSGPLLDQGARPRNAKPAASPPVHDRVEVINEQQLLALFPNRQLALIGKPGEQQLIFLDGH